MKENSLQEKKTKWDIRFFDLCKLIATWSEDDSRKVGAVIVGQANEVRATGYNGLPRGVNSEISSSELKTFMPSKNEITFKRSFEVGKIILQESGVQVSYYTPATELT